MSSPATAIAFSVDKIALALTAMTAAFMALVVFLIFYFGITYRKGSKANRSNRKNSSWTIELINASTIFAVGMGFFLWSGALYYREFTAPKNSLDLYVIGKQWMWMFQYPGGPQQIGHIKVPLGRPVRLLLASDDVIHSFFIPAFRIKQDAVPGRYTSLWFEASELGEFTVLCTEFCGTSHSAMTATIEVVSPKAFSVYQKTQRAPAVSGAEIYRRLGCASCHETGGRIAPDLKGIFQRSVPLANGTNIIADENYLRRALFRPASEVVRGYRELMPTYQGQLSEVEVSALLQYLKSLRKEVTP